MNSPSQNTPIYNLLSLGQRGVGKTVFLAGSYADLKTTRHQKQASSMWFECLEGRDQTNLEGILGYISQTGEYPPPTMKITDFNFIVKQQTRLKGIINLCQFRWWDIPGEYATFDNPEFQNMVLSSHSCCIFINAARLVKDPGYKMELDSILTQLSAIVSLVWSSSIQYRFAIVFTQCDRIGTGAVSRLQIEQYLPPLNRILAPLQDNCRRFYTAIPIVHSEGGHQLRATESSEVFLWLIRELTRTPYPEPLEMALKPSAITSHVSRDLGYRSLLWIIGGIVGVLLLTVGLLFNLGGFNSKTSTAHSDDAQVKQFMEILKKNPQDFQTLVDLSNRYIELEDYQAAIPVMETIVQQKPQDLQWQLNLAALYKLAQNSQKSEEVYDRILTADPKNLNALIGKALIRQEQGDLPNAVKLLKKAENLATDPNLKARIREMYTKK